jgi:glycogen synthase
MRLLLYARAFHPSLGGIEQATLLLARELSRRGHRVTVATDVEADRATDAALGFEVLRARPFAEVIRAARAADLVHASGYSALGYPLAAAARRPLVFTHHGYQARCLVGLGWHDGIRCGGRLARCSALTASQRGASYAARQVARHAFARGAQGWARAHVAVSRFLQEVVAMPRSTVIPNGIDTAVFARGGPSTRRDRFLFVGRFVAEKGVEVLLRAVALSARRGAPLLLDLVGAGPLENAYRRLAGELEIDRWVAFRGPLRGSALATAMHESLAVVVPSTWDEAFGIVAAEAISSGRLAVVSNVGGLPEVVDGLECVAPPGDEEAWARLLMRVRDDDAWRSGMEARLPGLAARFTEAAYGNAYVELYERVLEHRPV